MLKLQESGRFDAKGHYVIVAKPLDGIWPVGHACAVLCWGTAAAAGATAQHCTAMTNWPNTIQCLGSDDIMSLGIKSSATEVLGSWSLVRCYLLLFVVIVVAMRCYLLLIVLLFVAICCYLLLIVANCCYLLLFVANCYYLLLFVF